MDAESLIDYAYVVELAASFFLMFKSIWKPITNLKLEYASLLAGLVMLNGLFLLRFLEDFNLAHFGPINNVVFILFLVVAIYVVWRFEKTVRELSKRERILVLVSSCALPERLTRVMSEMRGKVCYISLTNACPHSKELFERVAKSVSKVRFLAVSEGDGIPEDEIKSQRLLLSKLLMKVVEKKYDYILIDDLSSFGLKSAELEQWVSRITNVARKMRTGIIFLCNKDNLAPDTILDLEMFMDKTIK